MVKKKRLVVAMSGGVDSSVAALLLKKQGYEVIGITMCFSAFGGSASGGNPPDIKAKRPACCGREAIEDARRVAHLLGIRHYVLNFNKALKEKVIENFCQEYLRGRTPNPCVRCNQYIKFGSLLKKARSLGADFLATGHYARIDKRQEYLLKKGKDTNKDQSYFLYRLKQAQLKKLLFPLGNYTKTQVRQIARENNLPVAEKLGSQEICFLPQGNYREFLKNKLSAKIKPGPIIDKQGNLLGHHQGIAFYTLGQREGLRVAKGYPLYIIKIEKKNNKIVVGSKEDAYAKVFFVKRPHYIGKPLKNRVVLKVKIRYNHRETEAECSPNREGLGVVFKKAQLAVTPGQSAVFYREDQVIGGGIIEVP